MDALSCALLPASCSLCGSPLPKLLPVPICDACWTEFPLSTGSVCFKCGDTVDALAGPEPSALCRMCRLAPPPFRRAVSFAPYSGRMKEAIHALKYDHLHPAAHPLGIMLAQAIAQLAAEAPIDLLVVPIPLHRSKHAERGFNQARSLAVHALQSLAKTHPQWRLKLASSTLMRTRATQSQAGLAPHMRRINLRGAFAVTNPAAVAKKNILLVDDILTTGATARAAAKALHQAGAADIWVATLARARRIHASGRKSSLQFDDGDRQDSNPLAGTVPAAVLQTASRHSLHGQSSF